MIELRLEDGTRLDLRGDEVIAITYAVNDIASIQTRQGVTSNEFNLPITDFNLKALGYPTNFNVNQDISPFRKIPASIYEEELRIAKGYIQITNPSISGNVIPVTFFGENSEWFTLIKGKSIRDLDLSEWRHTFQPSTIAASFANTEGYKYSLIDRNGINFLTGDDLSCQNFTICTFQSTIAKAIIEEAGFKIRGTLLTDPLYKKTVIADTNDRFYSLDQNTERNTSLGAVETTYPAGTVQAVIDYVPTAEFAIEGDNYNAGVYTADTQYLAQISVSGLVTNTGAGSTTITVELQVNGVTISSDSALAVSGAQFPFQITIGSVVLFDGVYYQLQEGDQVRTVISTDNEPVQLENTSTADLGGGLGDLVLGSFAIRVSNAAIEGAEINIEATLPDIDQAEFIQEFVFDHNALVTVNLNTKEIRFDLKKYDYDTALDWSKKIDLSQNVEISYTDLTSNYAQLNDVVRTENDDIFIVEYNNKERVKYGNGQFTLQNEFLDSRGELFESLFSPVITINSLNQSQALPYIIGEKISGTYEVTQFTNFTIKVDISSDIEDFLKLNPNTVYALITDSGDVTYERIYSISSITKDSTSYFINVNFNFPQTRPALLRLVTRDEESEPRKLIDGGNYLLSETNDTFTSYNITSILASPEDSVNITELPHLYFWNPLVNKTTDVNDLSLSYGNIRIPSLSKNLLDVYYEQTIDILQKGKVLTASFRLNQVDIFNLDFNKLIYLNFYLNGQTVTGYFILNKVEEYSGNADSTVCELIKI